MWTLKIYFDHLKKYFKILVTVTVIFETQKPL